jgi:glycosyltransferase involved in cell wall biosynthesis
MEANGHPRVVLVHDWLTGMRGGEKCLEVVCRRWPDARLFTLLHHPGSVSPAIEALRPRTSILQLLPFVHRYYRYLLPLMPAAVGGWRLPACDLLLSFSHCVAKAVRPPQALPPMDAAEEFEEQDEEDAAGGGRPHGVPHVCYCFTPMRYAWHQRQAYFGSTTAPGLGRLRAEVVERLLGLLRAWDRHTARNVTHFVAISRTVQRRIHECYDRPSVVIYPPVDTDFYCPAALPRQDYYLAVSAFAPYKRLDLAVAACNRLGKELLVIGNGQDEKRLREMAGPTVHFLGWQPDEVIRDHLRRCRALLFPGEEDFGIVPVEAMACGTPVICLGRGGATETVVPPGGRQAPTGLWFDEPTADGLAAAVESFEKQAGDFNPAAARRQAQHFNSQRFAAELFAYLDGVLHAGTVPQQPDQALAA